MSGKKFDTIVIGSGASGYSCALRIGKNNEKSVCIITEGINSGTSRNTGSDKQTYYKLSLSGSDNDSVRKMAEDLFSYGAVDGDTSLCEASLSSRCFLNLCELGVPFPQNRYGEYVGYKTDHDVYLRATSAGPLTSKFMTEALEKKVAELKIPVFDRLMAIEILKYKNTVCGLICLNKNTGEYVYFRCNNVVLATGGPAGIYRDTVYPVSQNGMTSLALNVGASLQNMTEWQYGLASVKPRWNVSGTYMQVLPCFVSVDENGTKREFLKDYFEDEYEALSKVFLKGYQWPFDSKKVINGSSIIDLIVYYESSIKGRKIYLDYRKNPFDLENIDFNKLSVESYEYLKSCDSLFGTPIERLKKMNMPAIELYKSKGIDLEKEPLEITLSAQHNNGGIAVNLWWQTSVKGLFAVGECAGTHGIYRPGGSALNSGQVGALRASQYILADKREFLCDEKFNEILLNSLENHIEFKNSLLNNDDNIKSLIKTARQNMSIYGGCVRNSNEMKKLTDSNEKSLNDFTKNVGIKDLKSLYLAYRLKDIYMVQNAILYSMIDYIDIVKKSRGSAIYYDESGFLPNKLPEKFRFSTSDNVNNQQIEEIIYKNNEFITSWRNVRPIPKENDTFENVWAEYRKNKNIY